MRFFGRLACGVGSPAGSLALGPPAAGPAVPAALRSTWRVAACSILVAVGSRTAEPKTGYVTAVYTFDQEAVRRYRDREWNYDEAATLRARAALPIDEKFKIAGALWAAIRVSRPDWPTDADRRADLAAHISLSDRLKQVTLG